MIDPIVSKFQSFRNRLFQLFTYRSGATLDLIDATAAETSASSIVKFSLSDLFRRKYSSLTDVLSCLFRSNLKKTLTSEEIAGNTLQVTQLLAEQCPPPVRENAPAFFAIDCTANPRIYSEKVSDRTSVHAPNHVPGQKPITVGHEYSVLVHLPDNPIDRELHWVIPLSTKRVESHDSGPKVGLTQLKEVSTSTVFKDRFCVSVTDAAYSTRHWVMGVNAMPNVVNIARMRGNRNVYRVPFSGSKKKRGRPLLYGEEIPLSAPPQPDLEEVGTITTRKGRRLNVRLDRWNDVVMQGSDEERTHEIPFDLVRVLVTDQKGKPVYKRPLWVMITGLKRREVTSFQAFTAYRLRYDIEHFFRFGKQRLALINSQTCETRHEEGWHWIGLLAYNMLYHAKTLAKPTVYPWEKRKIQVLQSNQRPSQVQRDYGRIIRGIGTPAPIPKPRGKSPGRQSGTKVAHRPTCTLIRKSKKAKPSIVVSSVKKKTKLSQKRKQIPRARMRRVWAKDRPAPRRC